jgi:exodeoxyribonuclease V alpha subunit
MEFEKAVAWCETKTGKTLAPSQREALKTGLTSRIAIITGGPGVGKTTLVNSILLILRAKKVKFVARCRWPCSSTRVACTSPNELQTYAAYRLPADRRLDSMLQ